MKRYAVIGGGISGVAAAYQLSRLQRNFVLYEASARFGGIVETERRGDFVMECGPDSWVSEKPWARELAVELGLEDEIIPSNDRGRRTWLLHGQTLTPIPDGMRMMVPVDMAPMLQSELFSTETKLAYLSEPRRAAELKAAAPDHDESVADFVRRHFGDEVAGKIAGPLLSGVFGGDIAKLSIRAVMPAFAKMEREHGSLIVAMQKRARSAGTESSIFTTLKSGLGTLIDRMIAGIPSSCFRLNEPVLAVALSPEGWQVTSESGSERFDGVILGTPADATRTLLTPNEPRFDALLDIDASSAIVVALAFAPEQAAGMRIPGGFGFLVPRQAAEDGSVNDGNSLLACTFVNQKFPHRVPAGGVLLRAFFGGTNAPALLGRSDGEIVSLTREELSRALGPLPAESEAIVRRWPRSLPQYEVGHVDRVAEINRLANTLPGLALVGSAYQGVGLPDLIRDARAAADKLAGS